MWLSIKSSVTPKRLESGWISARHLTPASSGEADPWLYFTVAKEYQGREVSAYNE